MICIFWEIFYKLCCEKNLSPNYVAKCIGITSGTCTKWKNGTVPNGDTLSKLADFFGVSIDLLMGREKPVDISKYDGVTIRVADIFQNMNYHEKTKVLCLISEINQEELK